MTDDSAFVSMGFAQQSFCISPLLEYQSGRRDEIGRFARASVSAALSGIALQGQKLRLPPYDSLRVPLICAVSRF
jgi:hypothetical protein